MLKTRLLALLILPSIAASAQMWNGTDTLYGNEWIDFAKTYYRIPVADDGIYRIPYQVLADAGFPVATTPAADLRLYRYGEQVPLFSTTDGPLGPLDFVEFFGEKNRDGLDRHLFKDADAENLNPWYSLITDTAAYYLVQEPTSLPLRYTPVPVDLTNAPPKEPYCWSVAGYTYSNALFKRRISSEVMYSWFNGEGFGTYESSDFSVTIPLRKLLSNGPDARLRTRYACGLDAHYQRLTVNDSLLAEDQFDNWRVVQHDQTIPAAWLFSDTKVRLASVIGQNDRNSVAGVFIRYPRLFDFESTSAAEFFLELTTTPKYLEIGAFNLVGGVPVLYDVVNNRRYETTLGGGLVKVLLPPTFKDPRLWLVNPASGIRTLSNVEPVQFRDYRSEKADYIILSNAALFSDPTQGGADHVAAYADYRRSAAGGGHTVTVVDIHELYEQFAYGVRFHPLAVRNFVQFVCKQWPAPPRHLLLLGKGLDYDRFRRPDVQKDLGDVLFFVPTYGSPGADQLLVMREKCLSDLLLPVGRVAVTKPSEIRGYLDKVIEHEQTYATAPQTLAGKAWMKRVIHNSGGLAGEASAIRGYTKSMSDEIGTNRFGAEVHTFFKTSNDPIQLSSYEQMLDLLNGGVSVWMIFGHSSPNAVDFDIGAPAVYNNKGRYPLMMIMGCFSGLCSTPQQGIGEQFLLARDRGAIAYFASVNFSFADALHIFGQRYYARLGGEDYGKSIGEIMANTVADLNNTGYPAMAALLHQNLLQGDPAVRLHQYAGPDYVVDNQSVRFDPNPVSLEQPSVRMEFDVANIGENTGGQLLFAIKQRLPNDSMLFRLIDSVPAPAFRKKIVLELPVAGSQAGQNRLLVNLNPDDSLHEQPQSARFNNMLEDASGVPGAPLFVFANDVQPIAPENYGIVRSSLPTLWASTLNANAAPTRYLFELDTLESFDSPFRYTGEVLQAGGLLRWQPSVTLRDSTVYYWRVGRDSLVNGQVPWRQRSFIYLSGSTPGWNQSHFGQWAEDNFINLEARDSTRALAFADNAGFLTMNVAYRDRDKFPGMQNAYYEGFFGDAGFNGQGLVRGVALMLQDPNTGHYVPNPPNSAYNSHPTRTRSFFSFNTQDSLQRIALMNFMEQVIPDKYIVGFLALHPWNDTLGYAPRRWANDSVSYGKNLFQILEMQGAREARSLVDYTTGPHPYGFVYQKNNPVFDPEDTTVFHIDSVLNLRRSFQAKWSVGQFETPPIGPVKSWQSLHWLRGAFDDTSDEAVLSVLAVRPGQADTLLFSLENTFDRPLTDIPAGQFPVLKLRYAARDTLKRTATQPLHLRVIYEPVPEGALHPVAYFVLQNDTLEQGEPGRVSVAFANVSDAAFDSLLVRVRLENEGGAGQDNLRRLRPLLPGDTMHAALTFDTRPSTGRHRLLVEANPANDQPERYHFNNTLLREVWVARDVRNPLLDVTFDGLHILDGDIVSPQPVIVVELKDENRFLAMADTSVFSLRWLGPDGKVHPLLFSDPALLFLPADASNLPGKNRARLEWRPVFADDGDYRLIVNGRDATGNISGTLDYTVNFRVITHSSISNLLNYPNPFSTRTCFYYTLTGSETPRHFRLRIMTVSGRVVREVTEAEFGPLQAGTHASEFCWDGRDQYGDQLANGIYLYQVVAKKADGTDFDFFENTALDGYFRGGLGKMVLMR
ncbi:MAG: C25 family cysteine peptidase [Saprospiraceae bacterium]